MTSNTSPRGLSSLGPEHDISWADDPDRIRAKQLEMLQIDIDHSTAWVKTMGELVAAGLSDQEFTIKRMTALHAWEKSRKGAQKRLHYKYDPIKRKRHLAERDVKRTLAMARQILDERAARMQQQIDALTPDLGRVAGELAPKTPRRQREAMPAPVTPRRSPVNHPGLAALDDPTLQMLTNDLPELDIATAADEEILAAYRLNGVPDEAAQFYLGLINGTN